MLGLLAAVALAAPPPIPDRAPDKTYAVELADGALIDNAWAWQSTVACFAASSRSSYDGPQTLLTLLQKTGTDLIIRVKPAAGVDVSTWVVQHTVATRGQRPPNITAAFRCTTSWLAGAGEPESVKLSAGNGELEVVVGVVGAKGSAAGAISVDVWELPGRRFPAE